MFKKILLFIERFGLFFLVLITAAAFVAAVIETMQDGKINLWNIGSSIIDTITSEAKDSKGSTKLMHVFLTLTLGWAVIKVYMAAAGFRLDAFAARYIARHHVVILAGHSSEERHSFSQRIPNKNVEKKIENSALAIDIALALAPEHNVVLSIPGIHSSRLIKLWRAGVKVLKDDMELPDLLQAAGVNRAKMLIAMRDNYSENIAICRSATAKIPESFWLPEILSTIFSLKPGIQLQCKCMIEPLEVKQKFKIEDYLEDDSLARVRVFNESELIARCILRNHPPDELVAKSNKGVHVLLVGFGSVGQSIAIQLAQMGYYLNGKRNKPKITIVDKNVEVRWAQALKTYRNLSDWLQKELFESRIEDIKDSDAEKWLEDECPITMVYVCTKDEIANLKIARLLLRLMIKDTHRELSNVQVVALDPPGGWVLEEFAKRNDNKNRFKLFSLTKSKENMDSNPVAANLLSETDDDFAKALHENYCKDQDLEIQKKPNLHRGPAHKPWDLVAEHYRESNRLSADHLEIKLRAVGRILVDKTNATPAPISSSELELLAEMEHNRWLAEKSLQGWKYSINRNDLSLKHNNIVEYKDLKEGDKKKDRSAVESAISTAERKNKILVRKSD